MSVPESRRRANDKWDAENMAVLTCKIKRSFADAFRDKAKAEGKTVNAILTRFIKEYIGEIKE